MFVQIPTQVTVDCFFDNICHITPRHTDMVFKPVFAHVFEQDLKVFNLRNSDATIHWIRIVGEFSFTKVRFDHAHIVVCRDSEESERTFCYFALYCPERIYFA